MQKSKYYYATKFPAHVIQEAHDLLLSHLDDKDKIKPPEGLRVEIGPESWCFNNIEEFFAEYPKAERYRFERSVFGKKMTVESFLPYSTSSITVTLPERKDVERIFQVFERNLDRSRITVESDPLKVFIGHGQDQQWRDLKDHLHDLHGIDVVAYEIGPRAGLSIKEVLEGMLNKSSFALLILTGEDQHSDGELHARENVIHELGLFQGRLGFTRAIAVLEEDVKEFSNIFGLNQIRFSKGRIRETFGDILATIKREFEKNNE